MKYKGIELKDIADSPQIFNPPKKMLVWDDLSQKPKEAYVVAIIPKFSAYGKMNVIGPYNGVGSGYNSYYSHCAEIPEEPKKRATNRQLAKWLAQGNGETFDEDDSDKRIWTLLQYLNGNEDNEVLDGFKIRKWDDTEWHEPTLEYMGLEAST